MIARNVVVGARLFFGTLTLVALATQFYIHVHHGFNIVNFFSYFTNLSNLFASIVLLTGAHYLWQRRQPTIVDDIVRGTAVVCMALVGAVFSVLLRDVELGSLQPWVNTVVHYIMPVVMVVDWLVQPPKAKLSVRHIKYWVVFPLVYLAYSLVRGAHTGFYPYPFLNPGKIGGYGVVVLYALGICFAFLAMGWLLIWTASKRKRLASS